MGGLQYCVGRAGPGEHCGARATLLSRRSAWQQSPAASAPCHAAPCWTGGPVNRPFPLPLRPSTVPPSAVVNRVYARAVRNCPWVGQLWGRGLRALERSGAPDEQHAAFYDKALAAGLQVGGVGWGVGYRYRGLTC